MTAQTASTIDTAAKVTPMMQQFMEIKEKHTDCLLFYRMGDFYELFFDDAVIAAKVLDIALTKRGKHDANDIPMCGVPHHAYEPYLQKLIKAGHKVAICEQLESPEEAKKRGYKAVVKRDVVRIVTPGTLIEDGLLSARESNYIACLAHDGKETALAWVDISTGQFMLSSSSKDMVASDLARLDPKEIIIPDNIIRNISWAACFDDYKKALTIQAKSMFSHQRASTRLKDFYDITVLDSFGALNSAHIIAAGMLLEYIQLTQKDTSLRIHTPKLLGHSDYMAIDPASRRNLELYAGMGGDKKAGLLAAIDRAVSPAGARLLRHYLAYPLLCVDTLNNRLDGVEFFLNNESVAEQIIAIMHKVPDFERALTRVAMLKAGPRDLISIRQGLSAGKELKDVFRQIQSLVPGYLEQVVDVIEGFDELLDLLGASLNDEVGVHARDGGFICSGYHEQLDHMRGLASSAKEHISALNLQYIESTGVNNLKIKRNNVLGYYIEVTASQAPNITDDAFIHRQTLANVVRYTTTELKTLEANISSAADNALTIELEIFSQLCQSIIENSGLISRLSHHMAITDVLSAFATLAREQHYSRPVIDNSKNFQLDQARHPVVEQQHDVPFIPNDCSLSASSYLWLITGPNMAGKSTFLRQNAIIAIMAQMGCYVPAKSAHIGIVDKVFSRVGASDDLARGRSTFMVEMVETATILNQATENSLVILDEIGRGTATYDGLSIAWAVTEHMHNINNSRCLFATHYHELTQLTSHLKSMKLYTVNVKEHQGKVHFLYNVVQGAADQSYGVHVAKLAGFPKKVLKRAEKILHQLQGQDQGQGALMASLPLFANDVDENNDMSNYIESEVETRIKDLNIDELSPRQALDELYELKSLLDI